MAAVFTAHRPAPAPVRTDGAVAWLRAQPVRRLAEHARDRRAWSALALWLAAAVRRAGRSLHAVFAPDADACQAARGDGACWGVIAEKWRLIIFGRYPVRRAVAPGARDACCCSALLVVSCIRALLEAAGSLPLWVVGAGRRSSC